MAAQSSLSNQFNAPSARPAPAEVDESPHLSDSWLPPILILSAVLFNSLLAIINANVTSLSDKPVILCEVLIILTSHLLAVVYYRPAMTIWYVFTFLVLIFAFFRMGVLGDYDVKYFRDFFVIPTFILLGMVTSKKRLLQTMYILQAAVCVGVFWELLLFDSYANTLQIKQYYIDTRGYAEDAFWDTTSNLYVSATRPEARYFPFFDMHRMSSLYLEPVSLGNHVILMTAVIVTFWQRMSQQTRILMIAGSLLCLFACDGRLAVTSALLLISVALANRWLPTNFALSLLPLAAIGATMATVMLGFQTGEDNFPGRIAHTAKLYELVDLYDIMGLSNKLLDPAADSGIIYMMISQSIVVLCALWLLIVLGLEENTRERQIYKNSLCVYLSLTMLVSYAFLSIKTGAPLWFIYGALVGVKSPVVSKLLMAPRGPVRVVGRVQPPA
ncbi:MAG: hypothetical protein KTR21_06975 [Rhodobacteraceae bacterium]|nr:hypothetical protein [Paracoccaceae bacterium]